MSGLKDIVDGIDGGDPASAVNGAASLNGTQSLNSVVESQQPSVPTSPQAEPASATPDPSPAQTPTAASPSPASQASDAPSEAEQGESAAGFNLRQRLETQLGIDTSGYSTDDELFEVYAEAMQHAASILHDPDYQAYIESRKGGDPNPSASDTSAVPSQNTPQQTTSAVENSTTAEQPEQPKPSESGAGKYQTAEISDLARTMAEQGLIARDDSGVWKPKDPSFQKFADEYNQHAASVRVNMMRFAENPAEFLRGMLTDLVPQPESNADNSVNETIQSLQEQVKSLKEALDSRAQAEQASEIEKWQKSAPLRDEAGKLTPYAKQYMKFEQHVSSEHPNLSNADRHKKTIELMSLAGVDETVNGATADASSTPEPPKESFASKANRRATATTNGNGVNRLKDLAGKMPATEAPAPKGKAGLPSLAGLIAQTQSQLTD